jgi:hypothetical protein
MLKITHRPRFTHKVTAQVPVDGGFAREEFRATFQLASNAEADLASDTMKEAFLRDIVVELHDLTDADGAEVPWSDEARDAAFALPWVRLALLRSYFEAIVGARAGN